MTSNNLDKYFSILKEVAINTSPVAGAKVSAAIIYKNKIISIGTNSVKSNPFQKKYSSHEEAIYLHAEIAAIKNATRYLNEWQFSKSTLLVCRVKRISQYTRDMSFGMARPCLGCQKAIAAFDIKNVYYTTGEWDEDFEKL